MKRDHGALLLVLPALLFLAVFNLYPFVTAFTSAFFDWEEGKYRLYCGLANFRTLLFEDFLFWPGVRNMALLTVGGVLKTLTFPLLAAVLISRVASRWFQAVARNLLVLPMLVPGVAIVLLWGSVFDPNPAYGLANRVLATFGRGPYNWLGDPDLALPTLLLIGFPWAGGLAMLIYLAGLLNVPGEVHEAATLDGAGPFRRFWQIELPLIRGQLRLMLILALIAGIQDFNAVLLLTQGGPIDSTIVPGMLIYNYAFKFGQLGVASALGVVLFGLILLLTATNNRLLRSEALYE